MLLDTSGLYTLLDPNEPHHAEAVAEYTLAPVRVTHGEVLCELVPLAHARGCRRTRVLAFLNNIVADPSVTVVWVDETLHRRAVQLLAARLDKTYSLCDAISFVLMRDRRLTGALTTDHHFEQEGFARLLR